MVITPSGHYVVSQLPSSATGYDLGRRICALCGIPVERQQLFCNNKKIDLHKSLQMQGVVNDSNIILNLRLNGGAGKLSTCTCMYYITYCDCNILEILL